MPSENTVDITVETTLQVEADAEEKKESAEEIISQIQAETTTVSSDNPAEWSKAEIVEFYKNAAIKTNAGAKSLRNISLKGISINNGQYAGVMDFVSGIMDKIISKNSTEVDGDGRIIKGTWSYTVDINMNNYKVFGTAVNSTSIVMENVITLNGGL